MEALQLYYTILCVLIFGICVYFYWKRFPLVEALLFAVCLVTLPMSHLFHIIWGETYAYTLCESNADEIFSWTKCIGVDFYEVFLNSYEITVFIQVALLRGVFIYLCEKQRNQTMNYSLRTWWLYLIVFSSIAIVLSFLLMVLPGNMLQDYAPIYNVLALLVSGLIIFLFQMKPRQLQKNREEEEIPLKDLESISDSEI
tara:strand:- start:10826 stop:11422 length:597 start_codon:yes stop_codon:yes gene_type:complete